MSGRYPELIRLCQLLTSPDDVHPVAVAATADQLAAAAAERPDAVHRVHAAFGRAAASWASDPGPATESALRVAYRASVAITRAARVIATPDL